MHGFPGTDTVVEPDGHIGHGAVLHGCRVGANAMVGMNAVIMDNVTIGESSIIAAMAFVKANLEIPPRSLVAGVPGRILRELTDDEIAWKREGTACYQRLSVRSLGTMRETEALTEPESDRPRITAEDVEPLYRLREQQGTDQ
jgi:phenylacetic acid degradation protein